MKKIIIIILVLVIIGAFLFWKFGPSLSKQEATAGPVTLSYWGLWEDENLIGPAIALFEQQNPNIKVHYERKTSLNYRTKVQAQIREGVGPDVYRIHNSWLIMLEPYLMPAPADIFTVEEYKNMFYPIAQDSFIKNNNIYAAPMEVDGIALYINDEILAGVSGDAPRNWRDFIDTATKMTVRDADGKIKTAGAALGTASNVDHWSDILGMLLMQQPGVDLKNPTNREVSEVVRFYTNFIIDPKQKTWDADLPTSTEAFVQGRLGFYFAPSWRAHELRVANPNLKFSVVPVPQLSSGRGAAWASFWAEAVSSKSKFPKESWQFVKFLASAQSEQLLYKTAAQIRLFGEPYSLTSLSPEIANDPIAGAFVNQGPIYKGWYLSSNTFDNGINDEMIKYWEDAINAVLQGGNVDTALDTLGQGIHQLLDIKYAPQPAAVQ